MLTVNPFRWKLATILLQQVNNNSFWNERLHILLQNYCVLEYEIWIKKQLRLFATAQK